MSKKQLIVIIILAVTLGGTFETFKRVKIGSHQPGGDINSLLSGLDVTPFAQNFRGGSRNTHKKFRPLANHKVDRNQPVKAMQQLTDNQKGEFSFNGSPNSKKVAKNDKKKKSKKNKKKKDSKKNKKDENEESTEEEFANLEDELKDDTENKKDSDDNNSPEDEYVGGVFPPVTEQDKEEKTPISELIAEWSDALLRQPDYKLLNEFISQKQSGQIPDSVFYPVIIMLMEDSRESMKVMASYALGATPSSRSFELIITYKKIAPFGSRLSQELTRSTQNYATIQHLPALREVLYSSEDLEVIHAAILLVDQAATTILPEIQETSTPKDGDVTSQETAYRQQRSIFEGFTSILDSLATSSTSQDIANAASQAWGHITQYIPQNQEEEVSVVSTN